MLVSFLRPAVGDYGQALPGDVLDLPANMARELIRRGLAAEVSVAEREEALPERPFRLRYHADQRTAGAVGSPGGLVGAAELAREGVARAARRIHGHPGRD